MQTFFNRLLLISNYQGFNSLNDFALNGLKYESSSKLNRLKDETKKPSFEILLDIANKFENINIDWLLTGKGEMLRKNINTNTSITQLETMADKITIINLQKDKITELEKQIEELKKQIEELKTENKKIKPI